MQIKSICLSIIPFSVCYQLEQGVGLIIGPESSLTVKATYGITNWIHIPQIAPYATDSALSLMEYSDLIKVGITLFDRNPGLSLHRLKISPTVGNHKVLASIGLVTFYIKRAGKLKLSYPLKFINIHKGTK